MQHYEKSLATGRNNFEEFKSASAELNFLKSGK
jgi:hypothetical protein